MTVDVTEPYTPTPAIGTRAICECNARIEYRPVHRGDHPGIRYGWTATSICPLPGSAGYHWPRKEPVWWNPVNDGGLLPVDYVCRAMIFARAAVPLKGQRIIVDLSYLDGDGVSPITIEDFPIQELPVIDAIHALAGDATVLKDTVEYKGQLIDFSRIIQLRVRATEPATEEPQ